MFGYPKRPTTMDTSQMVEAQLGGPTFHNMIYIMNAFFSASEPSLNIDTYKYHPGIHRRFGNPELRA
jgi:hypothetical protein